MKKILSVITTLAFFALLITGCEEETGLSSTQDVGYFEYQYKYTIDVNGTPTAKTGLKRIMITHAAFAVYQTKTLPDSLSKFNQQELFLYTDGANYKNSVQPVGSSFIQATLTDTIVAAEKLGSFTHRISTLNDFAKLKVAACLALKCKVNKLNSNADSDDSSFELVVTGQDATNLYVTALSDDYYEVNAYGRINTSTDYKLYYKGKIPKEANFVKQ